MYRFRLNEYDDHIVTTFFSTDFVTISRFAGANSQTYTLKKFLNKNPMAFFSQNSDLELVVAIP